MRIFSLIVACIFIMPAAFADDLPKDYSAVLSEIDRINSELDALAAKKKEAEKKAEEGKKPDEKPAAFACPATSAYPGANGKKLGDSCSYEAGKYLGADYNKVAQGVIYRAGQSCYCHATKCENDNYQPVKGKCISEAEWKVSIPDDEKKTVPWKVKEP